MAQRVFTFNSPVEVKETIDMISKVVSVLRGKTVIKDNVIVGKWRSNGYRTLLPHKFTFYVGNDHVRVITRDLSSDCSNIKWEYGCHRGLRIWDDFISTLLQMFPNLDFGLSDGRLHIVSAKLISDGTEQSFYSASFGRDSMMSSLIGFSVGETRKSFSNEVLVTVRYSNGMILEGELSKKSKVYNRILVDLSKLNER